jgi:Fur family ferric uptake transcriptional regulator
VKEHSAAEEKGILSAHLVKNRLKRSEPREAILDVFLRCDHHVSVDELLRLVQKRRRDIGRTTVYRALKVFQQAGLAHELVLDGENRYERAYKRGHHDHFICNGCGSILEFTSPEIEVIQERHAHRIGFKIEGHRHQVYGQCQSCVGKGARRTRR